MRTMLERAASRPDARFFRRSSLLSLNTATVRKQGDLIAIIEACARTASAIDRGATRSLPSARSRRARGARRCVGTVGYCRGGMFTSDAARRGEVRDDNRRAVDEAKALGAPCMVLVAGGCRNIRGREAQPQRISWRRARRCMTPSPKCWNSEASEHALAIEPLHRPMPRTRLRKYDEAGAGHLRPARSAAHRGARRGARRLSHLVDPS